MKNIFLFLPFFFVFFNTFSQIEKPPVYKGCENESIQNLESCFNTKLESTILKDFIVPEIAIQENYKGKVKVVFLVTKNGKFEILYVNAMYPELEEETKRVFNNLPNIQPATYNGRAIDQRYIFPISIPLVETPDVIVEKNLKSTTPDPTIPIVIATKTEKTIEP